jgi:hypothetical protein
MASIAFARSTAVLHAGEATRATVVVSGLCVADDTGDSRGGAGGSVVGPGDRADDDAADQRQDDQHAGEQQPAPGGPPRLRLGRGWWLGRSGLGAFALLLEVGDVALEGFELAVEVFLLWRHASPSLGPREAAPKRNH